MRRRRAIALLLTLAPPCFAEERGDPCAPPPPTRTFGSEFIQSLPQADRFENPHEPGFTGNDAGEAKLDAERASQCEALGARLDDPRQRLAALEELDHGALRVGDCASVTETVWRSLSQERDPFLLYKALQAISNQFEAGILFAHREDFVALTDHPSADVRRRAAELLRGLALEPRQAQQVAAALRTEPDPWARIALASLRLSGHEAEVAHILASMIREGGSGGPPAMAVWLEAGAGEDPLLDVVQRGAPDRFVALYLLRQRAQHPPVRRAFLRILRDGSEDERLLAAGRLAEDPDVSNASDWLTVVLDATIPARARASLVWLASEHEAWRRVACQAKLADGDVAGFIDSWAARGTAELSVPGLRHGALERVDAGTVLASGPATVRCAARPFGPPRPGGQRLFGGAPFIVHDWFTQDGVAWVGTGGYSGCWIRRDALNVSGPPETWEGDEVLEADVPVEALDSLGTALADGTLELFDPVDGFTGIRVRDASDAMVTRWISGDEGRRAVLAAVEAIARLRASMRTEP